MRDLTVCFDCRHHGEHRERGMEAHRRIVGRNGNGGLMSLAPLVIVPAIFILIWLLS